MKIVLIFILFKNRYIQRVSWYKCSAAEYYCYLLLSLPVSPLRNTFPNYNLPVTTISSTVSFVWVMVNRCLFLGLVTTSQWQDNRHEEGDTKRYILSYFLISRDSFLPQYPLTNFFLNDYNILPSSQTHRHTHIRIYSLDFMP